MKTWLALIVTPLIALACQGFMYALVTPSCSMQTRVLIHAVAATGLIAGIVLTWLARAQWKSLSQGIHQSLDSDAAHPRHTRRFLAAAATAVAGLSCLVILTMWMGVWVFSPC